MLHLCRPAVEQLPRNLPNLLWRSTPPLDTTRPAVVVAHLHRLHRLAAGAADNLH